jgi:O-glycosyl hydrolase
MHTTSSIRYAASLLAAGFTSLAAAAESPITISDEKKQEMIFGLDFERLWHYGKISKNLEMRTQLAELAVKDLEVSYIRVAIDGLVELKGGDWSVYDRQLQLMGALRDANPKIRFFASPRPFHEAIRAHYGKDSKESVNAPFTCYPLNIGVFENPFEPEKRKFIGLKPDLAADYLIRHIKFLRGKGFDIAYLDAQNENTRFYRPKEISEMIRLMREKMGKEIPQVIAPSGWSMDQSADWVEEAVGLGKADLFDILSSHDTGGKLEGALRMGELARDHNKLLWNTEAHRGFNGPDASAAVNTKDLWFQVRAGFGGFNQWLSLGSAKKDNKMFINTGQGIEVMRSYHIFKHLVNTAGGGHYLDSTTPPGLASTAAFVKKEKLTLWILNDSDTPVEKVLIDTGSHHLQRQPVEVRSWGAEDKREGSVQRVEVRSPSPLSYDIQPQTLYCFTFAVQSSQ